MLKLGKSHFQVCDCLSGLCVGSNIRKWKRKHSLLVKVVYQNSLHEQGDLREKPQNSQKYHFEGSVAENIKACLDFAKKHNSDLNTMRKELWSNET